MAPGGKRLLIGCGVGCLGLLVLAIGSCIGFTAWLNQPGDLLEPATLWGADTSGYIEWRLSADDPGTRRFVEGLMEHLQRRPEDLKGLPPALARMLAERQNAKRAEMQQLLPLVAVWTLQPGDGSEDLHLFSVSIERLGNRMTMVDWVLGLTLRMSPDVEIVRHKGESIFAAEGREQHRFIFFIHDQDLFFSNGVEPARQAIDRLSASTPPRTAAPTDLELRYAALPPSALRGAVANLDGELRRLWETVAGGAAPEAMDDIWTGIRGLTVSGGFSGETSFDATIEFHCVDAAWAASHGTGLAEALRQDSRRDLLPAQTTSTVEGDRIRVNLRFDDLPALLN